MDLIHDHRVPAGDQVVLKPSSGNPGGDDYDVPVRSLRSCLPFAIHYPGVERLTQNGFGNGTDSERLSGPRADHDPKAESPSGPLTQLRPVLPLQQRVHLEAQGKL